MSSVPAPPAQAEPHGQAALLLVESLIHGLVAERLMPLQNAAAIVEVALDAQVEMAAAGRAPASATGLLEALLRSLSIDLPDPRPAGLAGG